MSDPGGPGGRRTPFIPRQRTRDCAPDEAGIPSPIRPTFPTQRRTSSPSILPHQRRPTAAAGPPPGQVDLGRAIGTDPVERSDPRAVHWPAVLRLATAFVLVGAICADALGWRYPAGVATNHDGSLAYGVLDPAALAGLGVVAVALMFGVLLRAAAAIGIILFFLTWASHVGSLDIGVRALVAVVLLILAARCAGDTWGFGRRWSALALVRRHRWLR